MTDDKQEKKPFSWEFDPRREFRDWVRSQFPDLPGKSVRNESYPEFESRIPEVHQVAMEILDMVMTRSDRSLREYYAQDLDKLQAAYRARDWVNYSSCLDSFVFAIEVE